MENQQIGRKENLEKRMAVECKLQQKTEIPFRNKQPEHLYKMINQVQLSGVPSRSLAQRASAFTSSLNSAPWIIDPGASDHMTSQSHLLTTYSLCSSHLKIRIA